MMDLRTDEGRSRIAGWLARHLPGGTGLRIDTVTTPAGGGASAETLLLDASYERDGERVSEGFVLRRSLETFPLFLESDLGLQYQAMAAIARHPEIPAPSVVGFDPDAALLGAPFLVMRRVEGRIVPQKPPYNMSGWLHDLSPLARGAVWRGAIEAMALVHRIDWRDGFSFLHDPRDGVAGLDGYLGHVRRWYDWAAAGRPQPVADAALRYLRENRPNDVPVGVLWGDATPANLLFRDDGSVGAIIDWEMAALGPGEVDLGWWMFFDSFYSEGLGLARLEGLPTREETIAIYAAAAGRDVLAIDYFEILAMIRLNIVSVRQFDRQVAKGTIPASSRAYLENPITRLLARKLGLPEPEVGADFQALLKASTSHQ